MPTLWHAGAYHVVTYGLLLGGEAYQSFVGGIVAFRALPRPQFATLQAALFPTYFALQTLLPVALAATYPGASGSLTKSSALSSPLACAAALLEPAARTDLAWIAAIGVAGALNQSLLGPMTTRCMRERKHQETRDGRKSYDPPPHSDAMARLNRRFAILHGWSSLVNLVAVVGTIVYGARLGLRIA